jgi:hypothetical protein
MWNDDWKWKKQKQTPIYKSKIVETKVNIYTTNTKDVRLSMWNDDWNRSTWRKSQLWRNSQTICITYCCIEYTSPLARLLHVIGSDLCINVNSTTIRYSDYQWNTIEKKIFTTQPWSTFGFHHQSLCIWDIVRAPLYTNKCNDNKPKQLTSTTLPYNRLLKMALFTHNAVTVVVTIEW